MMRDIGACFSYGKNHYANIVLEKATNGQTIMLPQFKISKLLNDG